MLLVIIAVVLALCAVYFAAKGAVGLAVLLGVCAVVLYFGVPHLR